MNPGSVLHDSEFPFKDSAIGNKLLIVLNDGSSGNYIVVKTTSNPKLKSLNEGCHHNDRFPNFFILQQSSLFNKDTWIMLEEFYELELQSFLQKKVKGIIETIGELKGSSQNPKELSFRGAKRRGISFFHSK